MLERDLRCAVGAECCRTAAAAAARAAGCGFQNKGEAALVAEAAPAADPSFDNNASEERLGEAIRETAPPPESAMLGALGGEFQNGENAVLLVLLPRGVGAELALPLGWFQKGEKVLLPPRTAASKEGPLAGAGVCAPAGRSCGTHGDEGVPVPGTEPGAPMAARAVFAKDAGGPLGDRAALEYSAPPTPLWELHLVIAVGTDSSRWGEATRRGELHGECGGAWEAVLTKETLVVNVEARSGRGSSPGVSGADVAEDPTATENEAEDNLPSD